MTEIELNRQIEASEQQRAELDEQRQEANDLVKELEANVQENEDILRQIDEEEERIQQEILKKEKQTEKGGASLLLVKSRQDPQGTEQVVQASQANSREGCPGQHTKKLALALVEVQSAHRPKKRRERGLPVFWADCCWQPF